MAVLLLMVVSWSFISAQTVGDTFNEEGFDCKVVSIEEGKLAAIITGGTVPENGNLMIPATIEHEGQVFAVDAIGDKAFGGMDIITLDLSAATSLASIGASAFAECTKLQTVIFPKAETSKLKEIGHLAFHHAYALQSMNLEDTHLEVLESFFSKDEDDEISIPGLKEIKLPETLREIKKYALQFLDIKEIEIPSGVTSFADCVLEGCIYLEKFTWKNAQITNLPRHTFHGVCDVLEEVTLLTVEPLKSDGLTDRHFYMCDKDLLHVYVTPESLASLAEGGYTNETAIFSTLVAYEGTPDDPMAIASPRKVLPASGDDAYYTLQGIRVQHPQPGQLYIQNGHKVIFR